MSEEEKRYEFCQLHSGGPLPGLPGDHAPGSYVIDWALRTITPALSIEAFLEAQAVANQEEIIPEPIPEQPAEETPPALPEEQQSQNEQASSETAEPLPAENVTNDTSSPPIHLSLG